MKVAALADSPTAPPETDESTFALSVPERTFTLAEHCLATEIRLGLRPASTGIEEYMVEFLRRHLLER